MRFLSIPLALLLALPVTSPLAAQTDAPHLTIIVEQGEGAINNIKQRTAREAIVRVEDENHKPVAGAAVIFTAPSQGAGGSFAAGGANFNAVTGPDGRAFARGFHPNSVQGQFQIHVTASKDGQSASTTIGQTNAVVAGAAAAAGAGISTKLIVILAVAAAAATGGALYATHSGGSSSSSSTIAPPITVTAGSGTVGPPH